MKCHSIIAAKKRITRMIPISIKMDLSCFARFSFLTKEKSRMKLLDIARP